MTNFGKLMDDNFDAIVDKMMEMEIENNKYQVDLYIYPDGELYEFTNIGGTSWLNDDHFKICEINGECTDYIWDDGTQMTKDEIREAIEENRSCYADRLMEIIDNYNLMYEED